MLFMCFTALFMTVSAQQNYHSEVWSPDNGNGTYTNPVINADYSDPDVCVVGDDYYLTASSFQCIPGLPILHSKDLVNWEIIGYAVKELQPREVFDTPSHGNGIWAPSIRYHNGEFYIYWGDPDYGVFMVKAKDPAGEWTEPLCVIPGKGMIDTCPLWDDDGRCYLVNGWANSRSRFASVITVRELNAEGTKPISQPVIVFDGNGTENRTCEGPKFYKREGWYWIMCPAGGVPTGFQLAMRAKTPYGPYEVKKVLAQGNTNINGPHQGGWVHTAMGEDWFLHFQDKECYGRVVHLQPVTWRDNWPVMGVDNDGDYCGEPVVTYRKPKTRVAWQVVNPVESDEFSAPTTGLQWQWQANYQQVFGMPTAFGTYRVYNHKHSQYSRKFAFSVSAPLYPFGYGLSYTGFEYGEPVLSKREIKSDESLKLTVKVKNVGQVGGAEAVQLYIRDEYGSVTRPVKELKGVKKVYLEAGESTDVVFDITPDMLSCWGADEKWTVEPGEFTVMAGSSSADEDLKSVSLKVI